MLETIITLSVLAFIATVVAIVFGVLCCKKSKKTEDDENSVLEEARKRAEEAEKAAAEAKKAAEEAEAKAKKAADDAAEQIALADEHAEKAVAEAEAAKAEAEAARKAAEEAEKAADEARKHAEAQAAAAAKKEAAEAEAAAADDIEALRVAVADVAGAVQHYTDSVDVLKNDIADTTAPTTGLFAQLTKLATKFRQAKAKAKVTAETAREATAKVADATANKRDAEVIEALNAQKANAVANSKKAEDARQNARNALVALKADFTGVLAELKAFDAKALADDRTGLQTRLKKLSDQQKALAEKLPDSVAVKKIGEDIDKLNKALASEDLDTLAGDIASLIAKVEAAVKEIDDLLADKV